MSETHAQHTCTAEAKMCQAVNSVSCTEQKEVAKKNIHRRRRWGKRAKHTKEKHKKNVCKQ